MNNDAIVVGPKGAVAMDAMDAWADYARRMEIENPLNKLLKLLEKNSVRLPDGSYTIGEYNEEDKELAEQLWQDKYAYMRARDRFQVEWLASMAGWEVGYEYAKLWDDDWNDLLWYYEENVTPCDCGECNIFCKYFEDCIKKGFQ